MKRWVKTDRERRWLHGMVAMAVAAASLVALAAPAAAATTVADCPATEDALIADIGAAGAGGTVAFTCATDTTIPFTAPITVDSDLTLDASGATGTVAFDGGALTRATADNPDGGSATSLAVVTAGATLNLDGLTLQNAHASPGNASRGRHGAIDNAGTLNAVKTTFTGNVAGGSEFSTTFGFWVTFSGNGAALFNTGTAHLTDTTFAHNDSFAETNVDGDNAGGQGGAVYNGATMTVSGDSSFFENSVEHEFGGGGAAIGNNGDLTVTGATFAGNDVGGSSAGSAIYSHSGSVNVTHSIFAPDDNVVPNIGSNCFLLTIEGGQVTIDSDTFADASMDTVYARVPLTIAHSSFAPGVGGIDAIHLTITDTSFTGAPLITASDAVLARDTFTQSPGAALLLSGDSSITDSEFTTSSPGDTEIVGNAGSLTIQHSSFHDNGSRPFMVANAGTLTVDHTTFSDNQLRASGQLNRFGFGLQSAAPVGNEGILTVTDSRFSGNVVTTRPPSGIFLPGPVAGGIANAATATVSGTTFVDNTASGPGGSGGGVANAGQATLRGDTFAGNTSLDGGGGVMQYRDGSTTITDSTFWQNTGAWASAVFMHDCGDGTCSGPLAITHSTLVANTPLLADDARKDQQQISQWRLGYSIVAGPPQTCDDFLVGIMIKWDDFGPGMNITDQPAACWRGSNPNDVTGADLKLDPAGLTDNGGPTQTIRPMVDSPAIDFVSGPGACTGTDQRGVARADGPGETACDAGAYESSYVTTATAVTSSTPTPVSGQQVTFTATVTTTDPSATTDQATPSGNVQFQIDGTDAGAPVALTADGKAKLSISTLGIGDHTVTATFAESGDFLASSSTTLNQTVGKAATTTTVQSSANPTMLGQSLTLKATVAVTAPGSGPVTGSVTFADGATTIGTAPVTTAAGKTTATLTTSALRLGAHQLTASYAASATLTGSSSSALNTTVQYAVKLLDAKPPSGKPGASVTVKLALQSYVNGTLTNVSSRTLQVMALCLAPAGATTCATPTITLNSPFTFVSTFDKHAGGYQVNVQTSKTTPPRTYVLLFRAQGESSTTWHADANATITLR